MSKSKKHHYVPQALLRNFSADEEQKQIFVFDKASRVARLNSIKDAAAENYFNTLTIGKERISFESAFQEIDSVGSVIVNKIIDSESVDVLSEVERKSLCFVVSAQLVRTKLSRTSLVQLASELGSRAGVRLDFGDQKARIAALRQLLEIDKIADYFENKRIVLIRAHESNPFITSDNPVVMFNVFPYGEQGLDSKGIQVYYPISSDLSIGFYCESIVRKMSSFSLVPFAHKEKSYYSDAYNSISAGKAFRLKPESAGFLNELQLSQSSRFLYSSNDDFEFAELILKKRPELSLVLSRMKLGTPEEAFKKESMPNGLWLVHFDEDDHGMMEVDEFDFDGAYLELTIPDSTKADFLSGRNFECVSLYQDGSALATMREVVCEVSGESEPSIIRIRHTNESLNQILTAGLDA